MDTLIEALDEAALLELECDNTGRALELRLLCIKHRFVAKVMKRRNGQCTLICGCVRAKTLESGVIVPPMLTYPEIKCEEL